MTNNRKEIEQEWLSCYGEMLPKHVHINYAKQYLNWYKKYGKFDKGTIRQLEKLIEDLQTGYQRDSIKLEIKSGTRFIREFKGKRFEVEKCDNGYKYNNKIYRSLSAIANEITGTRWNGKKFFGLI